MPQDQAKGRDTSGKCLPRGIIPQPTTTDAAINSCDLPEWPRARDAHCAPSRPVPPRWRSHASRVRGSHVAAPCGARSAPGAHAAARKQFLRCDLVRCRLRNFFWMLLAFGSPDWRLDSSTMPAQLMPRRPRIACGLASGSPSLRRIRCPPRWPLTSGYVWTLAHYIFVTYRSTYK
jgi:hypothetical protein